MRKACGASGHCEHEHRGNHSTVFFILSVMPVTATVDLQVGAWKASLLATCLGHQLWLPWPPAFSTSLQTGGKGANKKGLRTDLAWACPRLVASPAPLFMEYIRDDI